MKAIEKMQKLGAFQLVIKKHICAYSVYRRAESVRDYYLNKIGQQLNIEIKLIGFRDFNILKFKIVK